MGGLQGLLYHDGQVIPDRTLVDGVLHAVAAKAATIRLAS